MKIDIRGLAPEQKQKVRTIVQLAQTFGGDEKMDNYLMSELMNVYLPEDEGSQIDKLASAYSLTQDPEIGKQLTNSLYGELGIDPQKKAENDAIMAKFSGEFNPEGDETGENTYFNTLVQQNPELAQQYFSGTPEQASFGERFMQGARPGQGKPFTGGVLGGLLAGLKSGESDKEKRARMNRLIEQYKSNIPNN
ncbi:MAG: hypothetical protein BWY21_01740 [Parcubacteria group bacterium ADurb.Bin216]|nr:MAG: hypothetical protein BWY21_01740 [Parcubacteria group bacterium ADurb.Bin216]